MSNRKSAAATSALRIIRAIGFAKRPAFQTMIGNDLGRDLSDNEFETIMGEIRTCVRRVRGAGGGIYG